MRNACGKIVKSARNKPLNENRAAARAVSGGPLRESSVRNCCCIAFCCERVVGENSQQIFDSGTVTPI